MPARVPRTAAIAFAAGAATILGLFVGCAVISTVADNLEADRMAPIVRETAGEDYGIARTAADARQLWTDSNFIGSQIRVHGKIMWVSAITLGAGDEVALLDVNNKELPRRQ
ncbi:hypothetical protein [Leifsonia sp. Leaf264]|uniref:hypothetical protein n=1 Tax=Leifsonia sp. Leaf264 TaxID=1736314 RepID=UPI0006F20056|nr:hypothetical protein [Leifsonia sp. Leaf264]KQO98520.1 hypothetical protein ASF30_10690 [Leifsonia sp. Leaf264]